MSKKLMDFDAVLVMEDVSYGIIDGSEKIVFIKGGRGSDHRGYMDKYLRMAIRLHERLGCSVITASNPEGRESYLTDEAMLRRQFPSMKKWVDYIGSVSEQPPLWVGGWQWGDWLGLDAPSGSYKGSSREAFIATAFFARSRA